MSPGAGLPGEAALVARLLSPACYPHAAKGVELLETHISWVLLAGDFAYKIKKPVSLGSVDFSTLAARRRFCEGRCGVCNGWRFQQILLGEVKLIRPLAIHHQDAPGLITDLLDVGGVVVQIAQDKPRFGWQFP